MSDRTEADFEFIKKVNRVKRKIKSVPAEDLALSLFRACRQGAEEPYWPDLDADTKDIWIVAAEMLHEAVGPFSALALKEEAERKAV